MPGTTTLLPENRPLADEAIRLACEAFGVTRPQLLARRNVGPEWEARAACCRALSTAGLSFRQIGAAMGGRHHRSPREACARLARETQTNADLKQRSLALSKALREWQERQREEAAA